MRHGLHEDDVDRIERHSVLNLVSLNRRKSRCLLDMWNKYDLLLSCPEL